MEFRKYWNGIDSLYLSYQGIVSPKLIARLVELKALSQSEDSADKSKAQITVCDYLFYVSPKGRGRFSFLLINPNFELCIRGKSEGSLPMAYIKCASQYIVVNGVHATYKATRNIVGTLGIVSGQNYGSVSRLDLSADFYSNFDIETIRHDQLVCRSKKVAKYWEDGEHSGLSIGSGGDIQARIYNKSLEIEAVSRKTYFHQIWKSNGWDGFKSVWRLEFELHREALKQLGLMSPDQIEELSGGIWRYLTCNWLRLVQNP